MKYLIFAIALAFSFSSLASNDLHMDVKVLLNNQIVAEKTVKSTFGATQTITAQGIIEVVLVTESKEDLVSIHAKLNKFEDDNYIEYIEANVESAFGKKAYFVVGIEPTEVFEIQVTTTKI